MLYIFHKLIVFFLELVVETGCYLFSDEHPPAWKTFVVLANRATDIDPNYEVKNPNDIALVLHETDRLDFIWKSNKFKR